MVRDARHLSEAERRRLADQLREQDADVDDGVIEPRRLDQMFSLRLDPELASALRDLANARGCSVSELLREAAASMLRSEQRSHGTMVIEGSIVVHSGGLPNVYVARRAPTGGESVQGLNDEQSAISGTSNFVDA